MKYERLTHQKYDENIDLTQEYGYSYIISTINAASNTKDT